MTEKEKTSQELALAKIWLEYITSRYNQDPEWYAEKLPVAQDRFRKAEEEDNQALKNLRLARLKALALGMCKKTVRTIRVKRFKRRNGISSSSIGIQLFIKS